VILFFALGLFDEDNLDSDKPQLHEDDLDYYKNFLIKHISKKLICTNPDPNCP
jgi:hypothetical protein